VSPDVYHVLPTLPLRLTRLLPPAPGATIVEMQAEIRRGSAAEAAGIPNADDVIARVFAREPMPWLRGHDYQV